MERMFCLNFSLGITLYHPKDDTFSYLEELSKNFQAIYVYDNSNQNATYKNKIDIIASRYNFDGKNRGLSKAFNWFLENAKEDKSDYLLLLDQDSSFDINLITELMKDIKSIQIDSKVAIHACNAKPWGIGSEDIPSETISEVDSVISSGSFVNMHSVKKYNLEYDERLFIDHVDFDFCRLVKSKALKIVCHNRYVMPQELGYLYNNVVCHSPIRHYYLVRDFGYMNDKYYTLVITQFKSFKYFIRRIFITLREDRSSEKIKYCIIGYRDYLRKITGVLHSRT